MTGTVVVGLGGNALLEPGESGTYREQCAHARAMAGSIAGLTAAGWRVVVVHGNGPQVGTLAVQQHAARDEIPPQPLFSLVAMTQGEIGSILALALHERLGAGQPGVVSVGTHVIVHGDDPAFAHPTEAHRSLRRSGGGRAAGGRARLGRCSRTPAAATAGWCPHPSRSAILELGSGPIAGRGRGSGDRQRRRRRARRR